MAHPDRTPVSDGDWAINPSLGARKDLLVTMSRLRVALVIWVALRQARVAAKGERADPGPIGIDQPSQKNAAHSEEIGRGLRANKSFQSAYRVYSCVTPQAE